MRTILILTCLALSLANIQKLRELQESMDQDLVETFQNYKIKFSRKYVDAGEEIERLEIFGRKHNMISEHNRRASNGEFSYTLGHNQFSDRTKDEVSSVLMPKNHVEKLRSERKQTGSVIYNFTTHSKLLGAPRDCNDMTQYENGIKNQGQCGSCWAFATTATCEVAYNMKYGTLYRLSDMQLTACSVQNGCGGAWPDAAYRYLQSTGYSLESDYPYCDACSDNKCEYYIGENQCDSVDVRCDYAKIKQKVKVLSWYETEKDNEIDIAYTAQYQPCQVIVAPGDQFMYYEEGIFTGSYSWDYTGIHSLHAVSISGMGKGYNSGDIHDCVSGGTKFYILKNSWDTWWGEKGFMRIVRTDNKGTYGADKIGIYGIYFPDMTPA